MPRDERDRNVRRLDAAERLARHCGPLPFYKGGVLPSGLQSITFSFCVDRSLDAMTLPRGLQSNTFGNDFDQSLEPPCSLLSCEHPFHCLFDAAGVLHFWNFVMVTPERMG